MSPGLDRDTVLAALDTLAPLRLAADWDNVGLLVDPPGADRLTHAWLTIDLTGAVLREALDAGADLIIAYHPPIFSGLKRLVRGDPKQRLLLEAIAAGVSLYSPHTALDAAAGGVNDWLLEGIGAVTEVAPLEPARDAPALGAGRRARLATPRPIEALIEPLKAHLGLQHLRIAATGRPVETVAVCPGAGGSLFAGLSDVDLLLTGEMRHHDVLRHTAGGASVILTDHTHTERGYLPRYAQRLRAALGDRLEVSVSRLDDDPLRVV